MARNISDADRARARMQITDFERASLEEGRNISDEDRARARAMAEAKARRIKALLEEGRMISDADRARAAEKYMKRNDGGMAMSGRGKPVRTF